MQHNRISSIRKRRRRSSNHNKVLSFSLFTVCLLETIFWIAILSSSTGTNDINIARQFLVREQSNHTQSLILKNDWIASLKQFQDNLHYIHQRLFVRKLQQEHIPNSNPQRESVLNRDRKEKNFDHCTLIQVGTPIKKKKKLS